MVKNVLITGAAKRVGAVCVRALHAMGYNIILHYRYSQPAARQFADELLEMRPNSICLLQADLQDFDALRELAEDAIAAFGGVDVLINNASVFYETDFARLSQQQWGELMDCNLKAPVFLLQALAENLACRRGSVVNIVDIHAEKGMPGYSAYCIAKAGLAAMTRIMAKELAPEIRVNAVAPGAMLWPEQALPETEKQDILARIALQRVGEPDDIAKAVIYLCDAAEYVTGQILTVDGGRMLNY